MNTSPLESAKNRDLPASFKALKRAACRARELATQTGTALVIARRGVVTLVQPAAASQSGVQESSAPYKGQP
ncbi:MAG: hypothetical protein H6999_07240 [Hahellaceae bacterium]|nr:hypothetical protein [Hahellaceae bacterium]